MENWQNSITINPGIRFGKPCIKGTRITVGDILSWLSEGMSIPEILEDFPELKASDVLAALSFEKQYSLKKFRG